MVKFEVYSATERPVFIGDFYTTAKPTVPVIVRRTPQEFAVMKAFQKAIKAGDLAVGITCSTKDEEAAIINVLQRL